MELVPTSPVWRFQAAGQGKCEEGTAHERPEVHPEQRRAGVAGASTGEEVPSAASPPRAGQEGSGQMRLPCGQGAAGSGCRQVMGPPKMLKWLKAPISCTGPCLRAGWSFPGGSVVKNPPANARDTGSIPGPGRPPSRRKLQPTPGFLPGKSRGQRSLEGYTHGVAKESDTTERLNNKNGGDDGPQGLRQAETRKLPASWVSRGVTASTGMGST